MLDSGCMMLDDQGMAQEWIVRVHGREYGPVDIDTLREWKAEGRLLPENEARTAHSDLWTTAETIPGLFEARGFVEVNARGPTQPPQQVQRRSFGQILAETFRIYRTGFFQFLLLTLLTFLPSVCGQLAALSVQSTPGTSVDTRTLALSAFAICMTVLTMVLWPVYIAGIQILTADFVAGRRAGFVAALNQSVRFWPRVAGLCIFVYCVFFLLLLFGLVIASMVVAGASSLFVIFLALALLVFQVWMFGRFFVNVLFWQQFAVLENAGFIDSLRESRNLARSGRELPWFQRPLWRGALIVSIWSAFVLTITLGPEWSTLRQYFSELTTTQDPQALLQQLSASQQARGFETVRFALNLLQRILQPLLGIAFVVLYQDSRIQID
jgi:GYF domain 2